jgi:hypothetical protein
MKLWIKKITQSLILLISLAFLITCDDPFKDDGTLIRTLFDDTIKPGIYMVYWDGKGKDNQTSPDSWRNPSASRFSRATSTI